MARDFNPPPLPIASLTPHPRHHRAALWWLGWLYRNPDSFQSSLTKLPRARAIRGVVALYLHALPWIFILGVGLNILLFHTGSIQPGWKEMAVLDRWAAASRVVGFGLVFGLGFCVQMGQGF